MTTSIKKRNATMKIIPLESNSGKRNNGPITPSSGQINMNHPAVENYRSGNLAADRKWRRLIRK